MKYHHGVISIGLIIILVCIAGCSTTPSTTQITPTPTPESILSTIDPSEMALQLSDMPDGFEIGERSERTRSDVSQGALDNGWKKGYYVFFQRKESKELKDIEYISQYISLYPIEKIDQPLISAKKSLIDSSNDSYLVEELSNPKIGNSSQAFRVKRTVLGQHATEFYIHFVKKDVYETFIDIGTSTDYENLKSIAKIAAAKIK